MTSIFQFDGPRSASEITFVNQRSCVNKHLRLANQETIGTVSGSVKTVLSFSSAVSGWSEVLPKAFCVLYCRVRKNYRPLYSHYRKIIEINSELRAVTFVNFQIWHKTLLACMAKNVPIWICEFPLFTELAQGARVFSMVPVKIEFHQHSVRLILLRVAFFSLSRCVFAEFRLSSLKISFNAAKDSDAY